MTALENHYGICKYFFRRMTKYDSERAKFECRADCPYGNQVDGICTTNILVSKSQNPQTFEQDIFDRPCSSRQTL